jgi:hypothetical protein
MEEIKIKHQKRSLEDVSLSIGIRIRTKWGWTAKVEDINQEHFKHGQGVTVKRGYDGKLFSILPSEIDFAL